MTTLSFTGKTESAGAECPPEDVYVLQLTSFGTFEEKEAFQDPSTINTQCRVNFVITDFDYDQDEDERDWNGVAVSDYFVFWKTKGAEKWDTWRNEKSNAYKLVTALLGHEPEPGEEIDLEELVGTKVKATITKKQSGYPKIGNLLPYRRKRKATGENPYAKESAA